MDGETLHRLILQRRDLLQNLLNFGSQQVEVIAAGRMSELMQLLAAKQQPLQELGEISEVLREAAGDAPETRIWPSDAAREQCRRLQDECEQMHFELLAIEAECETALSESRDRAETRLREIDSAHQAATRYAEGEAQPTVGARLDLSSD